MTHTLLTRCPVCSENLTITKLQCNHCNTVIENEFELPRFNLLSKEQLQFVETFLICRGNIKEVEKELGISYPTVRGKLETIVQTLGNDNKDKTLMDEGKIVGMLERGEITPDEAIKMLKE